MSQVLYFMQVPWDWVKQRPHFLAEGLADCHQLTVVHNKPYTSFKLVKNARPANLRIKELYVVPFDYLSKINSLLVTAQTRSLLASTDIVWLTHPFQYAQLKQALTSTQTLVYDCMDNMLEFAFVKQNAALYAGLFDLEKQLLNRCDLVIASSEHLKQELLKRYSLDRELHVVNNAIFLNDEPAHHSSAPAPPPARGKTISYIGTIAEWLDFELMLESLARNENITYHLYGPCEITIPQHERLKHFGRIEHKLVYQVMERSDALIMPFKLNDLVLSIDPVKLYEYAYSHKPAIAVRYQETLKFEQFVHLYGSPDEFFLLIEQLVDDRLGPKRKEADCIRFGANNTWVQRVDEISSLLQGIKPAASAGSTKSTEKRP